MIFKTLTVAFVVGAMTFISSPTFAASASTHAFMDNVSPNVDFLDQSSRLAITNTKSARVKAYARNEAAEQTLVANTLYDWANTATKVASGEPQLQTGRSVAIDGPASSAPLGQEELDALYGLEGPDFDTLYKQNQHDALVQVQVDYEAYIATGDDAALKAVASSELPKVKKRLATLGTL